MSAKKSSKSTEVLTGAQDLYDFLYKACDYLRGPVGHESFKDYLTPLLYYKRLSDVLDEEYSAALEESGGDVEYARLPEQHLFVIPEAATGRRSGSAAKTSAPRSSRPSA